MKEFDKIYLAKYKDILTSRQLAEDLRIGIEDINSTLNDLNEKGLLEIYKGISDDEWEKLENKTDRYILEKYLPESRKYNEKVFKELIKQFQINFKEVIMQFEKYEYTKKEFDLDYMQDTDYEGEEWKRIGQLNYEISNYGRIKNITTKKLKQLKFNKYGMQVLLWQNSKSYTITISRLVAESFIRHLEKNEKVFHINNNIRDNYYKNLEIRKV